MKAILINPVNQSVRQVETTGELQDMYRLMGCNMIESPVSYDNGDTLYCNEEFWVDPSDKAPLEYWGFMFADWSYPVVGKSLIVGTDIETGNSADCRTVESFIQRIISFVSPVDVLRWATEAGLV